MDTKEHWDNTYASKPVDRLGWYCSHLDVSLTLIGHADLPLDAHIIDVGGGASTLVDDLLDQGYQRLTVLDLAAAALQHSRERLREQAKQVEWIQGDINDVELPASGYDLWHDRALFHFLTDSSSRRRYVELMRRALKPGGQVVIGTFAPEAPPRCSGLPVERYDTNRLQAEFRPGLELREHLTTLHITPGGVEQTYLYCRLRARGQSTE